MKLTVLERLILINFLPRQGNFLELKLLKELLPELEFSAEETAAIAFKVNSHSGQVTWDAKAAKMVIKDCVVSEHVKPVLIAEFVRLDSAKQLNANQISLYEKFVLAKDSSQVAGE